MHNSVQLKKISLIEKKLKDYIHNLVDGDVREDINQNLAKISFDKFIEYYLKNDKLDVYTVKKELTR